jgi:hypothetical protein
MVHAVGGPFQHFYLGAYAFSTLHIHATLVSTLAAAARDTSQGGESDSAFWHAFGLMLTVITFQNRMYGLGMDEDIAAFAAVMGAEWMTI